VAVASVLGLTLLVAAAVVIRRYMRRQARRTAFLRMQHLEHSFDQVDGIELMPRLDDADADNLTPNPIFTPGTR
jgi:hypothetical protein